MQADSHLISVSIVEEFERPGPRYTSYPTIPFWTQKPTDTEIFAEIEKEHSKGRNFSIYLHLPFCEKLCHFCACYKVIDPRREHASSYLEFLLKEVRQTTKASVSRLKVTQMHWGGGTPTFYQADDLKKIFEGVAAEVDLGETAELSVEANPTVTTREQLKTLRSLGFNRISFGVQDFDQKVQDVINRHQTLEQTVDLFEKARELGFKSLNMDLIYGLPLQTESSIRLTIQSVVRLRPDRIAFYSYANVPWKHPFQRRFKNEDLPAGMEKIQLYLSGRRLLLDAGYVAVGMDHFALPHDEIVLARAQGKLHRNFMGYTTQKDAQLLGFGISAISMLDGLYWQNVKSLPEYYRELGALKLPLERGLRLSEDDRVRRFVIMQLMCNFALDFSELEQKFQIEFKNYFNNLYKTLNDFQKMELLNLDDQKLTILPRGQLLIRNIALLFDAYLENQEDYRLFSMTI